MPNWCENQLTVVGKKKNLKAFVEKYFNGNDLDFNKVIPEPTSLKDCPNEYIKKAENFDETIKDTWFDWYMWRCGNWGCKWNSTTVYLDLTDMDGEDEENGIITYDFDTPWDTPAMIIHTLIDDNPNLRIKCEYFEPGMFFGGFISSNTEYVYTKDELREKFENSIVEDE